MIHGMDNEKRSDLRRLALEERRLLDKLLDETDRYPVASAGDLIQTLDALDHFSRRRSELSSLFREEASAERRREEDKSTRQFVLSALDEIGTPQNAGFIQEYVWAVDRVDLNTRGFAALRRDERRSWARRPGQRVAYVVPALSTTGRALPAWMTRSDWALERRLVIDDTEELARTGEREVELQKVIALLAAREEKSTADASDPLMPLVEKYAAELFGTLPSGTATGGIHRLQERVEGELDEVAIVLNQVRRRAVERLRSLSDEQLLWGV